MCYNKDVANIRINQVSSQKQSLRQRQRFSQQQIRAMRMLKMSTADLREEIYKEVSENPALEIVRDNNNRSDLPRSTVTQQILENSEDNTETLQ